MIWMLEAVIKKYLNGRDLVIWGTGITAFTHIAEIESMSPISYFISRDAKEKPIFHNKPVFTWEDAKERGLQPSNTFVIILAMITHTSIRDALKESGFKIFCDYCDIYPSPYLLEETTHKGVRIGKCSGFPFSSFELQTYIVSIGSFCSINASVRVSTNHQFNMISTGMIDVLFDEEGEQCYSQVYTNEMCEKYDNNKVAIGNDVWIGANVFINASTCHSIGDGAVIGAGSIVTKDIPPYAVTYGVPAKVHRYRYSQKQIDTLMRVKWWGWDNETIKRNARFLIYPELFFERFALSDEMRL